MDKLNNSEWEVKDEKVKIGNDWKNKKQLQTSFVIELILFVGFVGLCIWAFTTNIIFGVVTLFVALFFLLLASSSYSAMKAVGGKLDFNLKKEKSENPEKPEEPAKKMVHKSAVEADDVIHSFQATLGKTTGEESQEIIKTLVIDGVFDINEEYQVVTQHGKQIGQLSAASITKLADHEKMKKKCKVVSVGENKAGKKTLKIEVMVLK